MKLKKLARLVGMLVIGWAVTIAAKLFVTAIVTSIIIGIVHLVGTILQVRLPYRTITVMAALSVLVTLVVLDVIRNFYMKRRTR
jgi:hypothetical protein